MTLDRRDPADQVGEVEGSLGRKKIGQEIRVFLFHFFHAHYNATPPEYNTQCTAGLSHRMLATPQPGPPAR